MYRAVFMSVEDALSGITTLTGLHAKIRPRLTGLPDLADRVTRLDGLPYLL